MNLTTQLDNLGVVKGEIVQQLGVPATELLFQKSIFLISTGSNDFVNNYNLNPFIQKQYNKQQYQQLVLDSISKNLQVQFLIYSPTPLCISLSR
jgi:hypothetical protein